MTNEIQGDQKNCLRYSTQPRICARYHHHVLLQGKICYKKQAATYDSERNVHELYHQKLLMNHNGWYPHPPVRLESAGHWFDASTPLVKEAEQALEIILQERFDDMVARLAPLSERLDPAELLMNPAAEARFVPHYGAEQYIPIVESSSMPWIATAGGGTCSNILSIRPIFCSCSSRNVRVFEERLDLKSAFG
ncbi:hypothetical protein PMIN03_010364 [Paraphaeosphaeria minitans]